MWRWEGASPDVGSAIQAHANLIASSCQPPLEPPHCSLMLPPHANLLLVPHTNVRMPHTKILLAPALVSLGHSHYHNCHQLSSR